MGRRKKRARLLARKTALLATPEVAPVVEEPVVETASKVAKPVAKKTTRARKTTTARKRTTAKKTTVKK
jgi:hypothetical protein